MTFTHLVNCRPFLFESWASCQSSPLAVRRPTLLFAIPRLVRMAPMGQENDPPWRNRYAISEPSCSTEAFDSIVLSVSAGKQEGRSGSNFETLKLPGFGFGLLAATY